MYDLRVWDDRSKSELKIDAMLAELKACEVLVQSLINGHDPDITMDTRTCLEYFDELKLKLNRMKELADK